MSTDTEARDLLAFAEHVRRRGETAVQEFLRPWFAVPLALFTLWLFSRIFTGSCWYAWFTAYSLSVMALWYVCNWTPKRVDRIAIRINELRALKPGWLNGEGLSITEPALVKTEEIARRFEREGRKPCIFPEPSGGVSVEVNGFPWVDVYVSATGETEEIR